jgi:hypothetical protein
VNPVEAAERGHFVFPLAPRSKLPIAKDWPHRATNDVEHVERWWHSHPEHNYGIACGPSHLLVLDVDVKHDVDGLASLTDLLAAPVDGSRCGLSYPATYEVATPTGGRHLYFRDPDSEHRNTAGRLGAGLDTRAAGGFVVGAGSRLDAGCYEVVDDQPIPLPPRWLVDLLARPAAVVPTFDHDRARTAAGRGRYSAAGLVSAVALAAEGTRNARLNWAALRVGADCRADRVTHHEALDVLDDLLVAAMRAGLTEHEAVATIRSGYTAGAEGRAS